MFRWFYNRLSWIDATQLKKEINCWRKQVNTLGFSPVFTAQLRQRPLDGEWQQERRPSPCRGRESLCVWFYSFSSVGHVRRPWCAFHNLVFFSSTFRPSCHFFLAPVRKHSTVTLFTSADDWDRAMVSLVEKLFIAASILSTVGCCCCGGLW